MKFIKIIAIIIAALFGALLVFSFTLPSKIEIERSIQVDVPQEFAYDYLINLKNWEKWTPWNKIDTTIVYQYPDDSIGVGAKHIWSGQSSETASLKITNVDRPRKISFLLSWDEDKTAFQGYMQLKNLDADKTLLKWIHYKDVGWNPFMRLLGSMIDNMMGSSFEDGLKRLKEKLEFKYNMENKKLDTNNYSHLSY